MSQLWTPKLPFSQESSRQLPDGSWPLDNVWPSSAIDFGQPGEPDKWLTLDVLRLVKLLYSQG